MYYFRMQYASCYTLGNQNNTKGKLSINSARDKKKENEAEMERN